MDEHMFLSHILTHAVLEESGRQLVVPSSITDVLVDDASEQVYLIPEVVDAEVADLAHDEVDIDDDNEVAPNAEPVQLEKQVLDPLPILQDHEGVNEEVPILPEEQQGRPSRTVKPPAWHSDYVMPHKSVG
ncbi:hypothetical protein K7X08_024973 [Anisodus acutangulus]|uniref:Uncharacterized protein n=1 Tax=Anisodus acutangulus TaxID=402998 RepID=A0A9Q1M8W1_9SOLA|nr:hypothetical protein K7X08_024973 [Anisodus acutangulus]